MAIGTPTERYHAALTSQTATSVFSPLSQIASSSVAIILTRNTLGAAKHISSVSDTKGNTWVVDHSYEPAGGLNLSVASAQIATPITTGDTITITWSSALTGNVAAWVQEVTGLATSSAFDKSADATASGTALSVGPTATLSNTAEIAWLLAVNPAGGSYTKNASWTNATTSSQQSIVALSYIIVAANTAITATATWGTTGSWAGTVVTYQAPASASSINQPGFRFGFR